MMLVDRARAGARTDDDAGAFVEMIHKPEAIRGTCEGDAKAEIISYVSQPRT
ncbi:MULTISPECIES: hypothetical protein [Bradyrhizobium]|uniref:hypothetical protein n=1 Tax=Bradyrhizobium TaxID=374 RepID=UPI000A42C467|nr:MULTISPECIES: hypothetical protein [Bradyrhizobium]